MFNPQTNKIVVRRDVVFEEGHKWSWDAAEAIDFSETREEGDGQFYSGGFGTIGAEPSNGNALADDDNGGADDGTADVQNVHQFDDHGGASDGNLSSAGGVGSMVSSVGIQSGTVHSPTTGTDSGSVGNSV